MSLLKKKTEEENIPDAAYQDEKGDYSVKSNKALNRVMMVVSLLAAFALWLYVYSTTITTDEVTFNLINIDQRYSETLASEYDLVVQSLNIDTVNVTLMGNKSDVSGISSTDVKAYINLRGITEAGEYTLDVIVDVPEGVTLVSQTVSQVVVSVDKSTEKTFTVDADSVTLFGWALENGYSFGEVTTNLTSVTVKGTSRDIDLIGGVGVRTAALGNVTGSLSSRCEVILIDYSGKELSLPGVQTIPNVESIEANITVYKEKTVPLTLTSKYGRLSIDNIAISPATVIVRGEPYEVDGIDGIDLGEIDETAITGLTYSASYAIPDVGLEIRDEKGSEVVTASVSVDLSALPSKTVSGVALYEGSEQIGTVSVNIVAVNATNSSRVMLNSISASNIRAFTDGTSSDMVVDIDAAYASYLFKYGGVTVEHLFADDPIEEQGGHEDENGHDTGADNGGDTDEDAGID